jgi:hypothetical protein
MGSAMNIEKASSLLVVKNHPYMSDSLRELIRQDCIIFAGMVVNAALSEPKLAETKALLESVAVEARQAGDKFRDYATDRDHVATRLTKREKRSHLKRKRSESSGSV